MAKDARENSLGIGALPSGISDGIILRRLGLFPRECHIYQLSPGLCLVGHLQRVDVGVAKSVGVNFEAYFLETRWSYGDFLDLEIVDSSSNCSLALDRLASGGTRKKPPTSEGP